jgi:hypothetical protein
MTPSIRTNLVISADCNSIIITSQTANIVIAPFHTMLGSNYRYAIAAARRWFRRLALVFVPDGQWSEIKQYIE